MSGIPRSYIPFCSIALSGVKPSFISCGTSVNASTNWSKMSDKWLSDAIKPNVSIVFKYVRQFMVDEPGILPAERFWRTKKNHNTMVERVIPAIDAMTPTVAMERTWSKPRKTSQEPKMMIATRNTCSMSCEYAVASAFSSACDKPRTNEMNGKNKNSAALNCNGKAIHSSCMSRAMNGAKAKSNTPKPPHIMNNMKKTDRI